MSEAHHSHPPQGDSVDAELPSRRAFVASAAALTACAGCGGYLAFIGGRYLYPPNTKPAEPVFIALVDDFAPGASRAWTAPDGAIVLVTRTGKGGSDTDFKALSNVCPHLGCKVHWEQANSRFFCPCHNGTFSPDGKGTGGPPGDAGQSLSQYPLSVKQGGLYIMVAPKERF